MSDQPPPSPPPPWSAPRQPMSRRRKVLLAVVGALTVSILVALVALNSVYESILQRLESEGGTQEAGAQLTRCEDGDFTGVAADEVPTWYTGYDLQATATPVDFPAAAFAWSTIEPRCGMKAVREDGSVYDYVFAADDVSRAEFEAASTMLVALGLVMNTDQSSRERQALPPGEASSIDPQEYAYLYRNFVIRDGGQAWIAFFADDLVSSSGTGQLVFGYTP